MTKYFSLLVLVALLASGCARAQAAKTTPDGPPLDVPAPPPRDVEMGGTEVAGSQPGASSLTVLSGSAELTA